MLKLKIYHQDFANRDRFVWINPDHIIQMSDRAYELHQDNRTIFGATVYLTNSDNVSVLHSPEEIINMIAGM